LLKVAGEFGTKIKELNFDDNGLREESFASILEAALSLPDLSSISYRNNHLGPTSTAALCQLISRQKLKSL
jgi:hypothetical protein